MPLMETWKSAMPDRSGDVTHEPTDPNIRAIPQTMRAGRPRFNGGRGGLASCPCVPAYGLPDSRAAARQDRRGLPAVAPPSSTHPLTVQCRLPVQAWPSQ